MSITKMPTAYNKKDVVKTTKLKMMNELDKFIFKVIGDGKIYKLREILELFPELEIIFYVKTRGYEVIAKIETGDFPADEEHEAERRVGIEFIKERKHK